MASDLDKFVLQYSVELKDSITRLENLQKKVEGVGKAHEKATGSAKTFASDVAAEFGKLVPGVDAATAAVGRLGASFGVASVAVAALAVGIKSIITLRDQFEGQRTAGMSIGVSGARMEEYQRKFVRNSGGTVSRQMTEEQLRQFSSMLQTSYTDPTRTNRESRIFRMLGVDPGEVGKTPTGINTALTQFGKSLAGMSPAQAQGVAKTMGLNQDFVLSLQKMGESVGRVTELTDEELQKRKETEKSLAEFNSELAKLKENFTELEVAIGQKLLPALNTVLSTILKIGESSATKEATKAPLKRLWDLATGKSVAEMPKGAARSWDDLKEFWKHPVYSIMNARKEAAQEEADKKKAAEKKGTADTIMNAMDEQNKLGVQTANEMNLAVSLFGSAVQSFSSAINIQQAWAAWAGEIGKASGLPGSSSGAASGPGNVSGGAGGAGAGPMPTGAPGGKLTRGIRNNNPGNIEYGPFAKSMGATGSDGRFAIFPTMEMGVAATEALLKGKGYMGGGKNTISAILNKYAPGSENDTGAYIRMVSRQTGIAPNAVLTPDQIPAVAAAMHIHESGYRGGSAAMYGKGESRASLQLADVQKNIADYLGVDIEQIQQGRVSRGDAQWALDQKKKGIQNNIVNLQTKLATQGMPERDYAKLRNELRDQQRGLELMNQFGQDVVNKQMAGERSLTIGERAITINVNAAPNPKETADYVYNKINENLNQLVNEYATGIKG